MWLSTWQVQHLPLTALAHTDSQPDLQSLYPCAYWHQDLQIAALVLLLSRNERKSPHDQTVATMSC